MGDKKAQRRADTLPSAERERTGENQGHRRRSKTAAEAGLFNSAFPLVNSKLKPPPRAAISVRRDALLQALEQAWRKKLVVLAAPGGSGKSTLLGQWYERASYARPVAWLSLDREDSDPVRFFSYLIAAVRSAVAEFDAYVANPRPAGHLEPIAALIAERLERVKREIVIALDDFQRIADPALTQAFALLVRRSPPNVHWIVSGRCMPDLHLSELRLQDDLFLIDRAQLNFDRADIVQLGRKLKGAALSNEDADRIRTRTEGWVAGVKLALLADKDGARLSEAAGDAGESLTGSHHEVARYLATTVLQEQTPEIRELMIASSVVDRLNGDLCNALLGISNGDALLEALEKAQLFLQPLDNHRHWYRYHHLFREFLRICLQREHGDRIPGLHLAASRWYAEHQMNEEALSHAFASGNRGWCVELIARFARNWLKAGEIASVLRWTAQLSRLEILSNEPVATTYIASLILCRRFNEATALLREAENTLTKNPTTLPVVRTRLRTLHMMRGVFSDTVSDVDPVDYIPGDERADVYLTGTLMALQAYWLLRRNRFDAARRLAMRARDLLKEQGSPHGAGYAEVMLCVAERATGNFEAVVEICEGMFAAVKTGNRTPTWVNAATALGHLRYEQNRLSEAEALCVEVLPHLSSVSTFENLNATYTTLARIKATQGRTEESFQLLDYLHGVLDSVRHRRFLAHVCYEKVRLHLLAGDGDRAEAVAKDFGLATLAANGEWARPRDHDAAWERLGLATAALHLQRGEYERCRAILDVLITSANNVGLVYRAVPLEAVLAVCEWRAGDTPAALLALNRGFAQSRKYGYTRAAFDEAPGLQDVITAAFQNRKLQHPLPAKYFERFQDLFAGSAAASPGTRPQRKPTLPLEPLTEREIAILLLLSQGLSNQEISERSQIALSTAKWHLKNVFAKLDVTTRTGALARARALQLID